MHQKSPVHASLALEANAEELEESSEQHLKKKI